MPGPRRSTDAGSTTSTADSTEPRSAATPQRAANLEKERQALLDELRRAAGLGGRDRHLNDDRERLRKTVTARIRDTLRRLDDRHPVLAAHLRASVHTGTACVYAPRA